MFDHSQIAVVNGSLAISDLSVDLVFLDEFETNIPIKGNFHGRRVILHSSYWQGKECLCIARISLKAFLIHGDCVCVCVCTYICIYVIYICNIYILEFSMQLVCSI